MLQGQDGLLFSYGVSNSGKTYTIQGSEHGGRERGIIPRSIDVIFNSIEGMHCEQPVSTVKGNIEYRYDTLWLTPAPVLQVKLVGQSGVLLGAENEEEIMLPEAVHQYAIPNERDEES